MQFKKFIEISGGYYDDREDRPTNMAGRQQDMPGHSMTLADYDITGRIEKVQIDRDDLIVKIEGQASVRINRDKYEKKYDQLPIKGDVVQVVFNRKGTLLDFKIVSSSAGLAGN